MRLGHQAIRASAGSGKTYRLAHRFLHLMAEGVPPDRICALTFSRKAAGEIFDAIVENLLKGMASDAEARRKATAIGHPGLASADFRALLRQLVDQMHRMHVGTLDSFIVGVVCAFPAEVGIPYRVNVMDGDGPEAADLLERILDQVYAPAHRASRGPSHTEFMEAYREATAGGEEKTIERRLLRFVRESRNLYQLLPDEAAWGRAEAIWPAGCPWEGRTEDPVRVAGELRTAFDRMATAGTDKRLIHALRKFTDYAAAFAEDTPLEADQLKSTVVKAMLAEPERLAKGTFETLYNRKEWAPSKADQALLYRLIRHMVRIQYARAFRRTQGLYRVLRRFDEAYDATARREGVLSFTDIQYLLSVENPRSAPLLSRKVGEANRLYIDYRLDSKLDHWLIDEFQDTSDLQWSVLRNLADEILQDASGTRTFFYVGDVKQAIYGWRGGNARLFQDILDRYPDTIQLEPMQKSYRSCRVVIDTVNRVFGDLTGTDLPDSARRTWASVWEPHESAETIADEPGYTCLVEPAAGPKSETAKEDHRAVVVDILRETQPLRHGLSVAILVRRNEEGNAIADRLRRELPGMRVAREGEAAIRDNPVVNVLLALLRWAAHPGDTLARGHLQMSPFAPVLGATRRGDGDLCAALNAEIHQFGFGGFLRNWAARLADTSELDTFGQYRLNQLQDVAGDLDARGIRDCDAFLRYADECQVGEIGSDHAIRILTIHKAKGLGFDMVILPDLGGRSIDSARDVSVLVHRTTGSDSGPWVLCSPGKTMVQADTVLRRELQDVDSRACFEALCNLYVGLTRAKRAVYMVVPASDSEVSNAANLLRGRLADGGARAGKVRTVLYEHGTPDWYRAKPKGAARPAVDDPPQLPARFAAGKSVRRKMAVLEPSRQELTVRTAEWFFNAEKRDVLGFGTAIHELFHDVEWSDDADADRIIAAWTARRPDAERIRTDVTAHFRAAFAAPAVRACLSRPAEVVELWREKSFEMVLDGQWISGVFDRVVLYRDRRDRTTRAVIIDYKSDRIDEGGVPATAAKYRPQLEMYGRVLAAMTGLAPSRITQQLVFTKVGEVWEEKAGGSILNHQPRES